MSEKYLGCLEVIRADDGYVCKGLRLGRGDKGLGCVDMIGAEVV